jgi:ATP-dependent Clp protease ATP-binding subunit ClpA
LLTNGAAFAYGRAVPHALAQLADDAAQRDQPWRALSAIVELRNRLEELESLQVENAREQGWSWSEIADPLHVSRQAVHRKHAKRLEQARRASGKGRIVWSAEARRCVVRARREAVAFGHDSVGTDHLLLGVLGQRRLANSLAQVGLTLERALFAVADLRGVQGGNAKAPSQAAPIPISQRAHRALDQSAREAVRLGDEAVRAEHILLALLRDRESAATRAADRAGIAPASIERRLRARRDVRAEP